MFREGDVIRIRDDFDWHSDTIYTSYMEGFQGKFGVVRSVGDDSIHVDIDDEDDAANWNLRTKDIEKVSYQKGDEFRVLPGAIERDGDNLYFPEMRNFEDTIVEFLHFESFGNRRAAYCKGTKTNGSGTDYWTFYLADLEPVTDEVFSEEISLDAILQMA